MLFLNYDWMNKNHGESVRKIGKFLELELTGSDFDEITSKTTLQAMRKDTAEKNSKTKGKG